MKKIFKKYNMLSFRTKVQIISAVTLTLAIALVVPVYAWFSNQKKAAEMFKIEYPNSLYINAANREDQVEFELGGININEYVRDSNKDLVLDPETNEPIKISKKQYVFSVSGTNTNTYTLQMAHTTNNYFTYRIYQATQTSVKPPSGEYVEFSTNHGAHTENPLLTVGDDVVNTASDTTLYYIKGAEIGNPSTSYLNLDASGTQALPSGTYYTPNYGDNSNVEIRDVPLYWQASVNANQLSNKVFCNYFILEVTWENRSGKIIEDKETDLIYFSVKRTS